MSEGWNLDNTYTRLPEVFFSRVRPTPVREPKLAILNRELAAELGLRAEALTPALLAGNELAPGMEPIAQAYAGHQFGNFTMLGDGRACLLGEQIAPKGGRFDIQLKGSGPTPYSRRGDGRAALGPMLREYIVSEAMHALDIPTTRSLAVVTTGEGVFRETPLPGAILSRVAGSHLRVGTFEYAAALGDLAPLRALADYAIGRHYPAAAQESEPYLAFLREMISSQAALIARWMNVGFIHGVMNTDNMAISGETIDYGPCAFMDTFNPATVFSSIDRNGRYAFGNQPEIALWNLIRFAEALLPLLGQDPEESARKAEDAIEQFGRAFEREWLTGMRAKLGLTAPADDDMILIQALLAWMQKASADYTNTFRELSLGRPASSDPDFAKWHGHWMARKPSLELMRATNPTVIARNHNVEAALAAAVEREDYSVMNRLLNALKSPFKDDEEFMSPPPAGGEPYRTFCGT